MPDPVISPGTRCQIVSQRLNSIYTGYSNRELILYTTRVPVTVNVDGSPVGRNWSYQSTVRPFVVCVDGLDCNNRGMVFTITTNYEDEAETILNKFVEVLQNPERDEPITLGSI
ncbi:COP23 domain-containing protein [Phormidium sp. CCY1219]|nr:COP23 domain-containing protein [Phormidium sp. CCY1219]